VAIAIYRDEGVAWPFVSNSLSFSRSLNQEKKKDPGRPDPFDP